MKRLVRYWWMGLLVVLGFVFMAASDCEEAFQRSPTDDAARITQAVPGASAEAEGVLVTLDEIVDPWSPDNPFVLPDPGNRFVAFHVTVQNVVDEEYSVSMFDFRLSDAADFVYDPIAFGHDSPLPFIYLGSGQMTEGWVTFEVNQGNQLKLLKYDPNIFTTSDIEFHFGAFARIEPSDSLVRGDDPQPDDSQGAQATSDTPTTMVQGSQCSQLMLGCDAVVTNTGTWLNVRDAPTINGAIVGRLEDGMTVLIVGDRVESDGYLWWQVESASSAGWAAEGDKDGTAWLIPSIGSSDAQGSVSYGPSLADTANEPSYCQDLAETRTELEAEDLWEYVKSQLEYSPNGQFLKECSAWGD